MTLNDLRALWIYAIREAYICGVRDGMNMTNKIDTFLECDPELNEMFSLWKGESK